MRAERRPHRPPQDHLTGRTRSVRPPTTADPVGSDGFHEQPTVPRPATLHRVRRPARDGRAGRVGHRSRGSRRRTCGRFAACRRTRPPSDLRRHPVSGRRGDLHRDVVDRTHPARLRHRPVLPGGSHPRRPAVRGRRGPGRIPRRLRAVRRGGRRVGTTDADDPGRLGRRARQCAHRLDALRGDDGVGDGHPRGVRETTRSRTAAATRPTTPTARCGGSPRWSIRRRTATRPAACSPDCRWARCRRRRRRGRRPWPARSARWPTPWTPRRGTRCRAGPSSTPTAPTPPPPSPTSTGRDGTRSSRPPTRPPVSPPGSSTTTAGRSGSCRVRATRSAGPARTRCWTRRRRSVASCPAVPPGSWTARGTSSPARRTPTRCGPSTPTAARCGPPPSTVTPSPRRRSPTCSATAPSRWWRGRPGGWVAAARSTPSTVPPGRRSGPPPCPRR